MNIRRMAAIAAILALLAVLSPALIADSDAALSEDGIVVSCVDTGNISIDSGSSTTVHLYVTNRSDSAVWIKVDSEGFGDGISATSEIIVAGAANTLLLPYDPNSLADCIATVTVTFSADQYIDTGDRSGKIVVTANDIFADGTGAVSAVSKDIPVSMHISSAYSSGDSYNRFFGIVPNTLGDPLDEPWFTALATFIIWIVATIVVSEMVIPVFTRLVGNRKTPEEKKKLRNGLTRAITGIMIFVAINECAAILGAGTEAMAAIKKVSWIFYVVFGASIGWQIYLFIVTAFLKGLEDKSDIEGMDMSLLPLFKMIGELAIGIGACCAILAAFGVDLAGILVSAGVVTLGITLGAQNTLNQFFSGIVLLATRPFKAGDFVRIGTETYMVRKVKLMYTEFKNWDGDQVVTMPNNAVSAATLVNLTRGNPWTRISVFIDVAYGSDIDLCKRCLVEGAKKHPHVISDGSVTPPSPRLTEFANSGITFKLAVWVDDFDSSSVYAGQIRELIYKELVSNGVEIPYNRLQIDILSDVPGKEGA